MLRPAYEAVSFARIPIRNGKRYLDMRCRAGMAAQLAASRGAQASGVDVAEGMRALADQGQGYLRTKTEAWGGQ
jgi:predicted TPR repeat methyltransferase